MPLEPATDAARQGTPPAFRTPPAEGWRSGEDDLLRTLAPFRRRIAARERVLEIGCGAGRITRALATRAGEVVGLDADPGTVDVARIQLADLPNVHVVLGNGRNLCDLADASFDVCYSCNVFDELLPDLTCGYIEEMGRVLRPGGWAVFQISDHADVEQPAPGGRLSRRLRRDRSQTPQAQWIGPAVPRLRLLAALGKGGLILEGAVGEGTPFCLLSVRRDPQR